MTMPIRGGQPRAEHQAAADQEERAGRVAGVSQIAIGSGRDHAVSAFGLDADHRREEAIDRLGPQDDRDGPRHGKSATICRASGTESLQW